MEDVPTYGNAAPSKGLNAVRERAKQDKEARFTTLLHHIDIDLLKTSCAGLKKDRAAVADDGGHKEYEQNLAANLIDLHGRIHRGVYGTQSSRGHMVCDGGGLRETLTMAALEDKIVQRAVVEVLSAIYEQDFMDFAYGFRPGRGRYKALTALASALATTGVKWIVYADLTGIFDSMSHKSLLGCIDKRIGDQALLGLIRKWLKSGVLREGLSEASGADVPEDSIAPLLTNIYLHHVFDHWADRWRRHHGKGNVVLKRYTTYILVGFEVENEAQSFLEELRERLEAFVPPLAASKLRLLEFDRNAWEQQSRALQSLESWEELKTVPNFRKGLTVIQGHSPFRVHNTQGKVSFKGLLSLLKLPLVPVSKKRKLQTQGPQAPQYR